jgi:hypothetical protein
LFETIERPALRPLPAQDYEYAEWRLVRVGLDYHVEAAGYLYSVPHTFIRAEVDVRVPKEAGHGAPTEWLVSGTALTLEALPGVLRR